MTIRALVLALAALSAAGCGTSSTRRPRTVVLASGADLQSINPVVTSHPLARQVQRYVLLTTLVRYDSTLAIEPYLARSWTWSPDSTVLTFQIRTGVPWHDGRPTTARDAAFTMALARDSTVGYPRRRDLAAIEAVEVPDDSTLVIRFGERVRRMPDVLTDLAIVPEHLLSGTAPAAMRQAAWNERPIGNGPFRFVRHEPNRRWVFEANPGFPPSLGGRPLLDRLVIAVVDEPTTKLAALASGELDFAGIQPGHAWFVRKDSALTVIDYPLLFSYAIVFNTRRPPFDRLDHRRAVGLAVDRLAIVSGYLFGFAEPASGPAPIGSADPAPPTYAPGRSRTMVRDSLAFELVTVGSGEAALEQMIQQQLARIGVRVTIRQLELATFLEKVEGARDFDAAVMGISGDLEQGYLRSLLDLTGIAPPRPGADLERFYRDSVPATFLYHARGVQGMNRRVTGVRMDIRGELPTVTRWRVR